MPGVRQLNNDAVPAVNELAATDVEWLASVAHTFLVAEAADGSHAAFLIGLTSGLDYASPNYRWFARRYERFAYVDRVVVHEDHRGGGLGQQLYDRFAEAGRADGLDLMLAEVNIVPHNHASLRFHDRYGFSPVGEQDTDDGAKRVVLLARPLEPAPTVRPGDPGGRRAGGTPR